MKNEGFPMQQEEPSAVHPFGQAFPYLCGEKPAAWKLLQTS